MIDSYVICTSPRSGSTLLCRLLSQTGVAGDPDSHFHEASLEAWRDDYALRHEDTASERDLLARIFQAAIARGQGASGVFGLRLQRHSFQFFTAKLAALYPSMPGDRSRLTAAFGRTAFIHLARTDKLEQAVSYVRAEQSGLWHRAPDGTELERLAPPRAPTYDAERIRHQIEQFAAWERDWTAWFDRERIEPLRLTYEDLSSDPQGTLARVLDELGLERGAARRAVPGVAKLADGLSRDWVERFRREGERP
jgi:LPS sulfotransferase NodH